MNKRFFPAATVIMMIAAACNSSGDKKAGEGDTTMKDTTGGTVTTAPAAIPFTKVVTYDKYSFDITTQGEGDNHHFKIIPTGLTESNDTLSADVKGSISNVIINDIDGDNSPEIGVIDLMGPEKLGHIHLFSTNNGKSISMVNVPDMSAGDDPNMQGYKGGDEFEFVENTLVRRFPIYEGDTKTGKTRQFQYKLKPGEAMKQLVLDKTMDY
ncbi:MAG: hypothetical protein ACO25B_10315 [Chitinophagaceae bacterium]